MSEKSGIKARLKTVVRLGGYATLRKGVIAMDSEYIISFMIILLLLVISIKK